jgi:hypothetical protein
MCNAKLSPCCWPVAAAATAADIAHMKSLVIVASCFLRRAPRHVSPFASVCVAGRERRSQAAADRRRHAAAGGAGGAAC